jgi:hypothetical protein
MCLYIHVCVRADVGAHVARDSAYGTGSVRTWACPARRQKKIPSRTFGRKSPKFWGGGRPFLKALTLVSVFLGLS